MNDYSNGKFPGGNMWPFNRKKREAERRATVNRLANDVIGSSYNPFLDPLNPASPLWIGHNNSGILHTAAPFVDCVPGSSEIPYHHCDTSAPHDHGCSTDSGSSFDSGSSSSCDSGGGSDSGSGGNDGGGF